MRAAEAQRLAGSRQRAPGAQFPPGAADEAEPDEGSWLPATDATRLSVIGLLVMLLLSLLH